MSKQVNAAIVGLGRWGQLLVNSVAQSSRIKFVAAVTRSPDKVESFCAGRNMRLSNSLSDVLTDQNIDALVIATPHTQHFDQLMAAAEAGKHVYFETPRTLDAEQGRTALQAFAEAGLKVAIGHNRRFSPNYLAMKALLESGELGAPIHIDGHFNADLMQNADRWRDSQKESPAGGMTSLGIHAVDIFVSLFGTVRDVQAQSRMVQSTIDINDSTLVRFNFDNGQTGHLTTIAATSMLWRIGVFCTGGFVEIRDLDKIFVSSIADGEREETFPRFEYPGLETITSALEAFAGDIVSDVPYPVAPSQIDHATAVLAAIVASSQDGRTVQLSG
ncbi:MAG: Gfo/Idh/MocA family protein [Rhizobiaceae bacterium]